MTRKRVERRPVVAWMVVHPDVGMCLYETKREAVAFAIADERPIKLVEASPTRDAELKHLRIREVHLLRLIEILKARLQRKGRK